MKSFFSMAALAVCCSLLFVQCTKDDSKVFHAHFYTTEKTGKMFLFIDGENKGQLLSFTQVSPCGDVADDVAYKPLSFDLRSGKYQVVGKDEQGNILSRSTMHISRNRMSVSGNIGGSSLASNDDCLSIGLFE